jgi:hypothetical protein
MSGSMLAVIIIPVVIAVALAVWIALVAYASRHPGGKNQKREPRTEVSGGVFEGDPRQQMPHRDDVPPEARAREDRTP